jgi:hypothetical protein
VEGITWEKGEQQQQRTGTTGWRDLFPHPTPPLSAAVHRFLFRIPISFVLTNQGEMMIWAGFTFFREPKAKMGPAWMLFLAYC